jgi:hypothetical protein
MLGAFHGKTIDLKCNEPVIPSFPDLLFGVTTDGTKTSYFNATFYINKRNLSPNTVTNFVSGYKTAINLMCSSYKIGQTDVIRNNKQGEILIESHFSWLFLSFVEQDFLAYMCERIQELFYNGFCLSDAYIKQAYEYRIGRKVVKTDDNAKAERR